MIQDIRVTEHTVKVLEIERSLRLPSGGHERSEIITRTEQDLIEAMQAYCQEHPEVGEVEDILTTWTCKVRFRGAVIPPEPPRNSPESL